MSAYSRCSVFARSYSCGSRPIRVLPLPESPSRLNLLIVPKQLQEYRLEVVVAHRETGEQALLPSKRRQNRFRIRRVIERNRQNRGTAGRIQTRAAVVEEWGNLRIAVLVERQCKRVLHQRVHQSTNSALGDDAARTDHERPVARPF